MSNRSANSTLVYSTDSGRICTGCGQPQKQCHCHIQKTILSGDGWVRVWRESKGRGGKTVTLARGFLMDEEAIKVLAKQLRTACGSGGTVKNGVIEIQGDHVERLQKLLQEQGYKVKNGP